MLKDFAAFRGKAKVHYTDNSFFSINPDVLVKVSLLLLVRII